MLMCLSEYALPSLLQLQSPPSQSTTAFRELQPSVLSTLDPKMKHALLIVALPFLLPMAPVMAADASPEGIRFFETKIRPVLVEHCYECHSAKAVESKKLKGKLLLDARAGVLAGGESGPAIVPGKPAESLLISALQHESFEMPPKSKLPDSVIADFVKWIELGAPDPRDGEVRRVEAAGIDIEAGKQFWSFRPLSKSDPPKVTNEQWVATDVDRFILARLEKAGIPPNAAAERVTLIRRLYFDLWGLPPERAEVEAFAADESPEAYEQLVDRLLEGQHYGERWARHWLDLARFAESNGYAFDKDRNAAYHYRDFVIKALNDDMPYDEFVRLQLAGDLIDPQGFLAQSATGFLAAGPFTSQQTQKERERSRYEQLDDIVGTLGTSMLGLTLGCARCHDHKFDPVGHYDYYRLVANFAETGFQDYNWDPVPDETKKKLDAFNAEHKPFLDARAAYEKEKLPGLLGEWEASQDDAPAAEKLGNWYHLGPFTDGSYKKSFDRNFGPERKVDLTKPVGKVKWVERPEWKDATIHNTLTGDNSANYLFRTIEAPEKMALDVSFGCDDGIKVFVNRKQVLAKATMGGVVADQHLLTLNLNAGRNELLVKIVNGGGPSGFYFSSKGAQTPKNILDILAIEPDKRNAGQKQAVLKWFAPRDSGWAELDQAEKDHLAKKPKPDLTPIFAARRNGATYNFGADTRKVYFLARGNSNSKTGLATPAYLRVLTNSDIGENTWLRESSEADAKQTHPRIALADWITDVEHGAGHLLARVIVNRLWQHHFGVGIVATPSDFGQQGARPTHPELLDYLANQLIDSGWRLKPVHRLIMLSSVYRQSGESNDAGQKADPDNQLWWRRPSLRMEAEIIRDNLLAVGGTLDRKMFGPGSLNEADARRSVYLKVKRGSLIPILQLFDAPDAIQSIGDRGVTTVPPQALALMNSPLIRQMAEKLAARVRKEGADTPDQIVESTFWTALSRGPSPAERERMMAFISSQADSYGTDANALNTAVVDYCQLMLCLNEFVYVD